MRKILNICNNFAFNHDLVFNPTKSKCIVSSKRNLSMSPGVLSISGKTIEWVGQIKNLGVKLTSTLSDIHVPEVLRQLRKFYACSNGLIRNFRRCSTIVKLTLFRTFCSNFYLLHLCYDYPNTSWIDFVLPTITCYADFLVFLGSLVLLRGVCLIESICLTLDFARLKDHVIFDCDVHQTVSLLAIFPLTFGSCPPIGTLFLVCSLIPDNFIIFWVFPC